MVVILKLFVLLTRKVFITNLSASREMVFHPTMKERVQEITPNAFAHIVVENMLWTFLTRNMASRVVTNFSTAKPTMSKSWSVQVVNKTCI